LFFKVSQVGLRFFSGFDFRAEIVSFRRQLFSFRFHLRVDFIRTRCAIDSGEHRLQAIVIRLGDRIEFVVMATRTVHREATKSGHGIRDHIVPVEITGDRLVECPFAKFSVSHKIPRPGNDETGGDNAIGFVG
jgi:hypothetical protein